MVSGQGKEEVQSCLWETPFQLPGKSELSLTESVHRRTSTGSIELSFPNRTAFPSGKESIKN